LKLALGTVQFGLNYGIANQHGQVSLKEAQAILKQAELAGLDTLDTAIDYGNSEQRLGEIGVTQWKVVSKLPPIPDGCFDVASWVDATVTAALQRLGVLRLRGLLLHRPAQLCGAQGDVLYRSLIRFKAAGVVQKIGISIYHPDELNELTKNFSFDMVQVPFNIIDHRLIDSGWLNLLYQQGTEVHVRSVFLQGLLLMQPAERLKKFPRWQPLWNRWEQWLTDVGLTPLQACLRFVLAQPQIERVIVGIDSLSQFKEILQAAQGDFPGVPQGLLECDDPQLLNPANWK
jgi:hypothetical protein